MISQSERNQTLSLLKRGANLSYMTGIWWLLASLMAAEMYDPKFFAVITVSALLSVPIFLSFGYYAYKIGDEFKSGSLLVMGISSVMMSIFYPPLIIGNITSVNIPLISQQWASGMLFLVPLLFVAGLFFGSSGFYGKTKFTEFNLALWLTFASGLAAASAVPVPSDVGFVLSLASKLMFAVGLIVFGLGLRKISRQQPTSPITPSANS